MKLPKLFLTLILIIGTLSLLSVPAFASSQLSVKGTAQIVSTGGLLLFDTNNSLVTVDSGTGDMTGFVWSEDLGWIDFDNNGNANAVKVDLNTGVVSGLAYVPNTGGLIDFTNYNSNTIINIATGDISGYAWSEDLGWIDFTGTTLSGSLLPLTQTGQNILPVIFTTSAFLISIGFLQIIRSKNQLHSNLKF